MALLEIRTYGDPVLKEVAQAIEEVAPAHRKLAKDMAETMYEKSGVGLAANQIGSLERIIVVDVQWARAKEGEKPAKNPTVMINPEVLEESEEDDVYEEGCLSIPGVMGDVWRPIRIKARYQTLEGKAVTREFEGLFARCIMHEVDHLNGVLFIDRMSKLKRRLLSRSLNQLLKARQTKAEENGE